MKPRGWFVGLLAASLFASPAALADTVTLTADQDSSIYEDATTNANGAGQFFHVGNNSSGSARRGLVRFPISSIPSGSTITSVTMTLVVDHTNGGAGSVNNSISLYRITQNWSEGTVNANGANGGGGGGLPATANSVTWSHRIYSGSTWSTAGGTASATASNTTVVAETTGAKTFSSSGMVTDVQAWVNGTSNYGWLLRGNETTNSSARNFKSRQHATSSHRPKLVVEFTPPATTGRCCFPNGSCQVMTPANCTSQGGTPGALGTSCNGNPCPQPTGACCMGNGNCSIQTPANCELINGTYQGNGTDCSPNPCPILTGACCFSNATCSILSGADCAAAGGNYQGDNTLCADAPCNWTLQPFVEALPIPAIAQPISGSPGTTATYEIPIVEIMHSYHPSLPLTRTWAYAGTYPGPTIEAYRNRPVRVTWQNELKVFGTNNYRRGHVLPVSTCLHGPDENGTVPLTVTHLHGAHLKPDSDGDPDTAVPPGSASPQYLYPNTQQAATMWYHDHALGLTRLNVYMGLAGMYLLRDGVENGLNLPSGAYEVPLVFQDRSFNADGSLKFNQTFTDHFFGDFNVVNGKVNPYMDVRRGKYRFRMLNGSNTRTYTLQLNNGGIAAGPDAWLIGTELGFLAAPLPITSITLMPGERADVVMDFSPMGAGASFLMTNTANVPFPDGGDGPNLRTVMLFRVQSAIGFSPALPATLATYTPIPTSESSVTRTFQLQKFFDAHCGHDIWQINSLLWDDIVDFPMMGSTEIWRWVNRSGLSHPMHIHLVQFQILDRQDFTVGAGGEIIPTGSAVPPAPYEIGWKDTVQATPNQITRVIARFTDYGGTFPFHCHILDHEDHEMMRQFTVLCQNINVTEQPVNDFVHQGDSGYFPFTASGSALTWQWFKVGQSTPLTNGPTSHGSIISGATTPAIFIDNAQPADEGAYYSVVTDGCGITATSVQATLTIACPADIADGSGNGNPDGGVDINDLLYFLAAFEAGSSRGADLDDGSGTGTPDGGVDINDLLYFLNHFESGC